MQDDIFLMLEIVRVPFSEIEGTLGMPKNYLSRFKNPKYNMPLKWINAITEYLEREFEIEIYCKQNNCTKRDLIELHKKYKDHDFSDLKEIVKTKQTESQKDNNEELKNPIKIDFNTIPNGIFRIEDFTKYPMKDLPKEEHLKKSWLVNKKKADDLIREQYKNRNNHK